MWLCIDAKMHSLIRNGDHAMTNWDQVINRHNCSRIAAEPKHTVGPIGKSNCHGISVAETLQ